MTYLDHAATSPLDPRVLDAMMPYLTARFGNPSSVHTEGRRARGAVEDARERIAALIGAETSEIIFTGSGTESDALAISGCLAAGGSLLTSAAEHEAVLRPAEYLAEQGRAVILSPEQTGAISTSAIEACLADHDDIRLVSLMMVNNEVGTMHDVPALSRICRQRGVLLHTDAVQAVGLVEVDVHTLGVDLLSASAHKFYGPKGAGFLFVRGGVDIQPLIRGSQERRRRGGTENVAAIVGMATALEIALEEREERFAHALSLRRRIFDQLDQTLAGEFVLTTPRDEASAAPHVVNVAFPPQDGTMIDGEMLILNMDMEGIAVSAGSACTSGALEPSHVLAAMGYDRATASAAVRFSTGKDTTEEEVVSAVQTLARVVERMRRLATVT
jgi:cysteine desulfurase